MISTNMNELGGDRGAGETSLCLNQIVQSSDHRMCNSFAIAIKVEHNVITKSYRMKSMIDPESVKLNKKRKSHNIERKLFRQDGTNENDIKGSMCVHSKKKRQKYNNSTAEDKTTESEQNNPLASNFKVDSQSTESDRLGSNKKSRRARNKNVTKRPSEHPDSIMSSKDHCSVNNQNCLSLLITNLPKHINYSMLKDAIPSAARLHLFRKSGKRLAFANFNTVDDYSNATSRLEGLEFDGVKVR
ncbi:hypothetical protein Smp_147540 [Schistosoma mansoni]|uniref:hypothetical protein n=1 Tax=Schistosoma mansoni TaxID=6183 RepID=UPI0001A6408A|nr:hypothetical protein Smp_147540 [Schistosoma mansoni]|eukprot:XP_018654743.1 hypothetical protein Smp_147540 [Schistosoma mansoni]